MAAGPARADAARVFGATGDDLLLTSFDELSDPGMVRGRPWVGLAAGPGMEGALAAVLDAGAVAGGTEVRVELGDASSRTGLLAVLDGRTDVAIHDIRDLDGHQVMVLGPATPGAVPADAAGIVLAVVPEPGPAAAGWPTREEAPPPARRRAGPRVQLVGAAGIAGVAALVVICFLVGRSRLGVEGVLVVLVVVALGLLAVLVVGVAYSAMLLRRAAADDRPFRSTVLRRSEHLVKLAQDGRERHRAQAERLVGVRKLVQKTRTEQKRGLEAASLSETRMHLATQRQLQAWSNLGSLVRLDAAVPAAGGWAASADFLLRCVDEMLDRRPTMVVECGSGLSTLILALAAEQHDLPTRIVALEHQESYAERTRSTLERHGVAERAEVRVAPLKSTSLIGHTTPWYAESALEGLDQIGMLLVDGPPTATGPLARFPAVPLLVDRLAERCLIVMDDMNRSSDLRTAELWEPLLQDFEYTLERDYEKHLGLFRRG